MEWQAEVVKADWSASVRVSDAYLGLGNGVAVAVAATGTDWKAVQLDCCACTTSVRCFLTDHVPQVEFMPGEIFTNEGVVGICVRGRVCDVSDERVSRGVGGVSDPETSDFVWSEGREDGTGGVVRKEPRTWGIGWDQDIQEVDDLRYLKNALPDRSRLLKLEEALDKVSKCDVGGIWEWECRHGGHLVYFAYLFQRKAEEVHFCGKVGVLLLLFGRGRQSPLPDSGGHVGYTNAVAVVSKVDPGEEIVDSSQKHDPGDWFCCRVVS